MKFKNKTIPAQISKEMYKSSLDNEWTCDLIIKCGSNLFEYVAHRIILAGASKFLSDALLTAVPGKLAVLLLPDIEPRTFTQILSYIYNGEVDLYSQADYENFVEGCKYLGITKPVNRESFDVIELESDSEDEETRLEEEGDDLDVEIPLERPQPMEHASVQSIYVEPESVEFDEPMSMPKPLKQKLIKGKILTNEERKRYLASAKDSLRQVYQNFKKIPKGGNLNDVINKTRLVFENKKFIRAEHQCGFCKTILRVHFNNDQKTFYYPALALQKHLETPKCLKYSSI